MPLENWVSFKHIPNESHYTQRVKAVNAFLQDRGIKNLSSLINGSTTTYLRQRRAKAKKRRKLYGARPKNVNNLWITLGGKN
jgi:hypothetical protein